MPALSTPARETLAQLHPGWWPLAFAEGHRLGLLRDGLYLPETDRDLVLMYSAGQEL